MLRAGGGVEGREFELVSAAGIPRQRQSIDGLPEDMIQEFRGQSGLVNISAQISEDQKAWLDKMAATSKVAPAPGDSVASLFTRVLLQNAMEQQRALERADPWADDDEM